MIQDDLNTPTVLASLRFDHFNNTLITFGWDARKVQRKTHQTVFNFSYINNFALVQQAAWQRCANMFEGLDHQWFLVNHLLPSIHELHLLMKGGLHYVHEGREIPVTLELFYRADGAGIREGLGLSSAASLYCMVYNDLDKTRVSDLHLFAPITRQSDMLRNVPETGLSHAALLK